ncbi:hypothetical protein PR202_gb21610 [Eleusine coracana subsp. coracana]|uniref:Phorbol-ester/DAG-type domain-containing protein n=1 Tax=Eleusine coracana subsp. coracana TaxID=191504 RepID=A0AAV5FEI0_ELECO|nr:hypothetical protein PR202_gb21610 [Eleusine coracana subsp. coracana]
MAQDSITHFSHPAPGHELVKRHYTGPFRCDICHEDLTLTVPAYGCRAAGCDFAIHDSCAARPQTHYTPAHPPHSLVLLQTRPGDAHTCDICAGSCAPGSFLYRCPPCGFDMHTRCAWLPHAAVRSARHPGHDLTLVAAADGRCAACHDGGAGQGWFYRCVACNVDFHVSCAAGGGGEADKARHDGHTGNGGNNVPGGAMHGGTVPVPVFVPDATQTYMEERLRRARIRSAHIAIARASDSIDMLGRESFFPLNPSGVV